VLQGRRREDGDGCKREADAKGTAVGRIDGQERSCRVAVAESVTTDHGPETDDRLTVENGS